MSETAPAWMQAIASFCSHIDPPGYGGCESGAFALIFASGFMAVFCFVGWILDRRGK